MLTKVPGRAPQPTNDIAILLERHLIQHTMTYVCKGQAGTGGHKQLMPAHECSARALVDRWNLIKVASWNLTDQHANVVCLRKPSQKGKGTRKTKKLECLLEDECGVESVMRDTGLLLESLPLASEDWAADVVRLRKSSYRSSRHAFKLESPLGFEKFSGKALQTHAMATFHTTCTLATTLCTKPASDGNEHGNLDEG